FEGSRMKRLIAAIGILFFVSGCSTMNRSVDSVSDASGEPNIEATNPNEFMSGDIEDPNSPFAAEVPKAMNELVEKWLSYFQGRGRKYMEMYLERSTRYAPLMTRILKEHGLPDDLIYVVFIESGFSSTATSHASAVGYWQFVKGTGKTYGLTINHSQDDRRDPELATAAAAKYFKSLYSLFGSWYLSLAAYNAGENRIKSVVMRNHSRNFWELASKRQLPRETMNYVPKYLAARLIGKNPAKYGFVDMNYQEPIEFAKVEINHPISLSALAKNLGASYADIKQLNPNYLRDHVNASSRTTQFVRVPVQYAETVAAAVEKSHVSQSIVAREERAGEVRYRVKRGDNLYGIAKKFGTGISQIRTANGMTRRSMLRYGQILKIPVSGETIATRNSGRMKSPRSADKSDFDKVRTHVVRRGETLTDIAKRYQTSMSRIAEANELRNRSVIRIGLRLVIPD
ncbi:MAG: LysM peptidoglycan-binding domain-containing protein, partial [Bdellovibrionales bacterium]|nr:LysM peptidoglycan-binding domain-containing protein [Bdellovibrionales bacterium]